MSKQIGVKAIHYQIGIGFDAQPIIVTHYLDVTVAKQKFRRR